MPSPDLLRDLLMRARNARSSADVADEVRQFADEEGVLVIDGQQLAELIVDNGLLRGKP